MNLNLYHPKKHFADWSKNRSTFRVSDERLSLCLLMSGFSNKRLNERFLSQLKVESNEISFGSIQVIPGHYFTYLSLRSIIGYTSVSKFFIFFIDKKMIWLDLKRIAYD